MQKMLSIGSQETSLTRQDSDKKTINIASDVKWTGSLTDPGARVEEFSTELMRPENSEEDYHSSGWSCEQVLAFQNTFFEVLEELRVKRALNDENNKLIKSLVSERHEVDRHVEQLMTRCKALADELVDQDLLLRQQYEERIQSVEDDKVLRSVSCENHQKEVAVLKQEIRQLQAENYEAENLNRELANKLEQQAHSRKVFVSRLSETEREYCVINKNVSEISDQLARLDANVTAAVKLNKRLTHVNSHQMCQVAAYERELERRVAEIVTLRLDLANKDGNMSVLQSQGKLGSAEPKTKSMVSSMEQEHKRQQDFSRQLESQLCVVREEHQKSLEMVRQGHELVKKHVEEREEAESKMGEMTTKMDVMKRQCEMLRCEIDKLREAREEEKRTDEGRILALKSLESELLCKVESIKSELQEALMNLDKLKQERDGGSERDPSLATLSYIDQQMKGKPTGHSTDDSSGAEEREEDEMAEYSSADEGVSLVPATGHYGEQACSKESVTDDVLQRNKDSMDITPPRKKRRTSSSPAAHVKDSENHNVVSTTEP